MESRIFECVKEFELPKYNADLGEFTGECLKVEKGTIWSESENSIIGGEIHLDNDDTLDWIEITARNLSENFKDITEDNNEMGTNEYLRSGY